MVLDPLIEDKNMLSDIYVTFLSACLLHFKVV